MITVLTGVPGIGKTSYLVSMLLEDKQFHNRPIFVMGIPDLKLEHVPAPPVKEWTEMRPDPDDPSLMLPYYTFPENAILILDEAQRVFRARSASSKVPDHVAALETHRHTGIDIFLLTQGPTLFDPNIKVTCGRHIHITMTKLGIRKSIEWPTLQSSPDSPSTQNIGLSKPFKLKKKAFGFYKSSAHHTKPVRTFPWPVLWLIVPVVLLGYTAPKFYKKWFGSTPVAEAPVAAKGQTAQGGAAAAVTPGAVASAAGSALAPVTAQTIFEQEAPRLAGRPETAPQYDSMRQVKAMPLAVAFVASKTRCRAYTQQGTVVEMDDAMCRAGVEHSRFNPYADPVAPGQVQQAQQTQTAEAPKVEQGGQRLVMGDANPKANMFDRESKTKAKS